MYPAPPATYTLSLHDALPISEDLDALLKLFDRIEADPALRVLVLTGTGRAFSSGYDLGAIAERNARAQEQTAGDRKSTRLNSSHRCISYAGFCWKKKSPGAAR